jgi:hypothetical protein
MAINLVNARTGVSTWKTAIILACRMSHKARFRAALKQWIGEEQAQILLDGWDVFCALFDLYLETDDAPFTIDYTPTGGEPIDLSPGA